MNPEEQRIAIAKACGLKIQSSSRQVPDYLNDLDAMHDIIMSEAEQKGFGFQAYFQLKLQEVVERKRPHLNREQIGWWMNNATAAQRAEAFLRVKGLWKD